MRRDLRLEWPTLGLIAGCYGVWLVAGFWLYPRAPVAALALMAVMTALHSSLVHECLHGHPTRHRLINEALVTLPLSLVYPFRRYRSLHLAHHHDTKLTDPLDDPESYYRERWRYRALPLPLRGLLRLNNTLAGRMVIGPWLSVAGFLGAEMRHLRDDAWGVRRAWALHLPAMLAVLVLVYAMGIPLWLYALAVCWPGLSLIALRTFAEHQWHEAPEGRTIIVERSPLAWLYLNNNLHIVHHRHPSTPWYALPALYRARRDDWRALNRGYVFPNYWALWRQWGFRAKEPVAHPVLRHEPERP
ncbi:fatty acid desaturase [Rhodobacter sp. NTK016B]|uniref:fatty acid desaturase n=1 Tax=Rhodobacter sp. NTK016B TaxID=2759676 RepID=UPI001A8C8AD0|nr:fatty acid desaturase [Rhodobacter sp. NTK016B]MBN8293648.1 fatty acid desaturase [Rhodobacter sp. NTK016B]